MDVICESSLRAARDRGRDGGAAVAPQVVPLRPHVRRPRPIPQGEAAAKAGERAGDGGFEEAHCGGTHHTQAETSNEDTR